MLGSFIAALLIAYAGFAGADVAAVLRAPSYEKPTWALRPTPRKLLSYGMASPFRRLAHAYCVLPRRRKRSLANGAALVAAAVALTALAGLIFALS